MFIEAIVQNGEEAIQAEKLGVDRLELVSAISEGGLTPSYGTMKQVLNSVSIPVQIMIRPHSYHYDYSEGDLQIIHEDIRSVLALGGSGIVFGVLNKDNTINERVLADVVNISDQLDITFHRAFDEVLSQRDAYLTLAKYKHQVKRILTSGGEANCLTGKNSLSDLVKLAAETAGPKILPGAGMSTDNMEEIHRTVQADQYHFGKALRSGRNFVNGFDEAALAKVKNIG